MATKPRRQHPTYLSTLQLIADQSRQELDALMLHRGELGRITEEIIKGVLDRTLPKRFSIGTGVIINSDGDVSAQTDIVIYDNFFISPLLSEYGARVFPVECVYATIEVKSILTLNGLKKGISDIMLLRKIGSAKQYIMDRKPVVITTPPRSYIVGFKQSGLGKDYDQFKSKLEKILNDGDGHVHGVCILEDDWFARKRIDEETKARDACAGRDHAHPCARATRQPGRARPIDMKRAVAAVRLERQHRIGQQRQQQQGRNDDDERIAADAAIAARHRLGQMLMRMAEHGNPRWYRESGAWVFSRPVRAPAP